MWETEEWGPPLVDEDWRAICQAIFKGTEGEEWERMYHKFFEIHKVVNIRHPSTSRNSKTLWKVLTSEGWGCASRPSLCPEMHRSVTTNILLPDMFLRCDTKQHWQLCNFDGYRSVRQDTRKGPRSTMASDRRWFCQVTAELQRMPINNSAST